MSLPPPARSGRAVDPAAHPLSISMVCYRNEPRELRRVLLAVGTAVEALKTAGQPAPVSLALVDNSETGQLANLAAVAGLDDIEARLAGSNVVLTVRSGHGNIGYGAAHNLAIRAGVGKYHLLLNPDVLLAPDSLTQACALAAREPDLALLAPYVENYAGERQYTCKRYPSVLTLALRGFAPPWLRAVCRQRLARYEMRDLPDSEPWSPIPIASGCCMFCRGDALGRVKGFDEGYFLYFEDFDLSLRLAEVGGLAYMPTMRIRHDGGNSARRGLRHIAMFARSAVRFYATHGWRWWRDGQGAEGSSGGATIGVARSCAATPPTAGTGGVPASPPRKP